MVFKMMFGFCFLFLVLHVQGNAISSPEAKNPEDAVDNIPDFSCDSLVIKEIEEFINILQYNNINFDVLFNFQHRLAEALNKESEKQEDDELTVIPLPNTESKDGNLKRNKRCLWPIYNKFDKDDLKNVIERVSEKINKVEDTVRSLNKNFWEHADNIRKHV